MELFSSWQFFALASAFFAALTAIFGKVGVTGINSNLATFIRTVVIVFIIGILVSVRSEWQRIETISNRTLIFLVLSALATGSSWLCYYRALQLGPVSKVASVDKLSVVLVILMGFIFLRETVGFKELIGATLITVGTTLMIL